jgi:hypothetical protein
MDSTQSEVLLLNRPYPKRTQEICIILCDLLGGDTELSFYLISILKEIETEWSRQWHQYRSEKIPFAISPKHRKDFSRDDIYQPIRFIGNRWWDGLKPWNRSITDVHKKDYNKYLTQLCIRSFRHKFITKGSDQVTRGPHPNHPPPRQVSMRDKIKAVNYLIHKNKYYNNNKIQIVRWENSLKHYQFEGFRRAVRPVGIIIAEDSWNRSYIL